MGINKSIKKLLLLHLFAFMAVVGVVMLYSITVHAQNFQQQVPQQQFQGYDQYGQPLQQGYQQGYDQYGQPLQQGYQQGYDQFGQPYDDNDSDYQSGGSIYSSEDDQVYDEVYFNY